MEKIQASPTKRFFVSMLTRDIELEDAILDLLDNCIDGILRTSKNNSKSEKPYKGFHASINFNQNEFTIEDNCGGIPYDLAKSYAFMMGRPHDENDTDIPTIGMYGIGMKRAIFKMGEKSSVISKTDNTCFTVSISPEWLKNDNDWELDLEINETVNLTENGTKITIESLHDSIASNFSSESFRSDMEAIIRTHYSFIILKGFEISINGHNIEPKQAGLLISKDHDGIKPYIFKGNINGVEIDLAVGFFRPIPDADELDEEQITKRSKDDAGWTIACNDRIVVYNDKTRLTGWGEAGVPSYHSQFIGISGLVHFKCNDAWKLPMTTTKRGIDTSSDLYMFVKDLMREGMKKFTQYTNKWKSNIPEEKTISENTQLVTFDTLFNNPPIDKSKWRKKHMKTGEGSRYIPNLPEPKASPTTTKRISFSKKIEDINTVSEYLFGTSENIKPSEVGDQCFEKVLTEAEQA